MEDVVEVEEEEEAVAAAAASIPLPPLALLSLPPSSTSASTWPARRLEHTANVEIVRSFEEEPSSPPSS